MTSGVTTFIDRAAVDARDAEVTGADWDGGCNAPAACAPGIGVTYPLTNLPAFTTSTGPNWSLNDQFTVARTPQVSQVIGGEGLTTSSDWPGSGGISGNGSSHGENIEIVTNPNDIAGAPDPDGAPTVVGAATLATLAAGWVPV
jgi:hypothetical protein